MQALMSLEHSLLGSFFKCCKQPNAFAYISTWMIQDVRYYRFITFGKLYCFEEMIEARFPKHVRIAPDCVATFNDLINLKCDAPMRIGNQCKSLSHFLDLDVKMFDNDFCAFIISSMDGEDVRHIPIGNPLVPPVEFESMMKQAFYNPICPSDNLQKLAFDLETSKRESLHPDVCTQLRFLNLLPALALNVDIRNTKVKRYAAQTLNSAKNFSVLTNASAQELRVKILNVLSAADADETHASTMENKKKRKVRSRAITSPGTALSRRLANFTARQAYTNVAHLRNAFQHLHIELSVLAKFKSAMQDKGTICCIDRVETSNEYFVIWNRYDSQKGRTLTQYHVAC